MDLPIPMDFRKRASSRARLLLLMLVLPLAACRTGDEPAGAQTMRLPVSHNNVMVTLINDAADPIWVAAWRNPGSEVQWRDLEKLGNRLQIGGALLTVPGTGPLDARWAGSAEWRELARRLNHAGARASEAARLRDVGMIADVGDEIVEVCEACHTRFKPAVPTGGIYAPRSPTAADFEE